MNSSEYNREVRESESATKAAVLLAYPIWVVRKNILHDYSGQSRSEHVVKTTIDFDWELACNLLQTGDNDQDNLPPEHIIIPISMPSKSYVISMDATEGGVPTHVASKRVSNLIGEYILDFVLGSVLDELEREYSSIPECIWRINRKIVATSSAEVEKAEFRHDLLAWLHGWAEPSKHIQVCQVGDCPGMTLWRELLLQPKWRDVCETFAIRYVRALVVTAPRGPIAIAKTSEVHEEKLGSITESLPLGALDIQALSLRRLLEIKYPADINMLKCRPPEQSYFEAIEEDKEDATNLSVDQGGSWAYLKLHKEDRGSQTEIRRARVNIVSRRSTLIFPGLILAILACSAQLYFLARYTSGHFNLQKVVDNPLAVAVTVLVPVLTLAYVSTSRHVLLVYHIKVYHSWLVFSLLAQLFLAGLASLLPDRRAAIFLLLLGLSVAFLTCLVFVDAMRQGSSKRFVSAREKFLEALAQLGLLRWCLSHLVWFAFSLLAVAALRRTSSIQTNVQPPTLLDVLYIFMPLAIPHTYLLARFLSRTARRIMGYLITMLYLLLSAGVASTLGDSTAISMVFILPPLFSSIVLAWISLWAYAHAAELRPTHSSSANDNP